MSESICVNDLREEILALQKENAHLRVMTGMDTDATQVLSLTNESLRAEVEHYKILYNDANFDKLEALGLLKAYVDFWDARGRITQSIHDKAKRLVKVYNERNRET